MLLPHDFDAKALHDPLTRELMGKMSFEHGGADYDAKYPDGIPTSMVITDDRGATFDSGLVMYPGGHARNNTADLQDILGHKFKMLAGLATGGDEPAARDLVTRYSKMGKKLAADVADIHNFHLTVRDRFE